ncbi:MAG: hypothetical protein R3B95_10105 [Nitrospirales bacterium]|nr:hypothetical protein [Nitrospirales bacterium]
MVKFHNFRELRDYLEKKGHVFKTRSDTEVIVHLYEEQGEACFRSLRGMFALAIWDRPNRSVILARDRVGKSLSYSFDGARLAFSSEMKALLAMPPIKREIDLEALSITSPLYVPAPKSIFQSIKKVRPGHYLVVSPKVFASVSIGISISHTQRRSGRSSNGVIQIVPVLGRPFNSD